MPTGAGGSRIAPLVGAALAALAGLPAQAQPAGYEALAGVWYENDWQATEIGPETVTLVTGDNRWVVSSATCPAAFEHEFSARTRADMIAFFGLDTAYPMGAVSERDGVMIRDLILSAWLAGDGPVATLWSYCYAETHGGAFYFLAGEDELTAIRYAEGDVQIGHFSREVPAPSEEVLGDYERREIQAALQRRSLYGGAIDGVFGPGTHAAIRAYQEQIGDEPTGILTRHQIIQLVHGG